MAQHGRMWAVCLASCAVLAAGSPQAQSLEPTAVEVAPGVWMPKVNLGTCCGSQPKVGLAPWLAAGGRGIDTAYDYGKTVPGGRETDIRAVLAASSIPRKELFITTKIPAGYGIVPGSCSGGAAESLRQVKENLKELGMSQVDLVLLHHPCHTDAENQGLWYGLEQALEQGLTRAIGVSNYKKQDLDGLLKNATVKPAVNQCEMSIAHYDAPTIAYTQSLNITYEAFNAMKGWCVSHPNRANASASRRPLCLVPSKVTTLCRSPFSSPVMAKIVAAHAQQRVGPAQVCLRWVLQRGAIMAVGTGANASTVGSYAQEDLNLFNFSLTAAEMSDLNRLGAKSLQE